MVETGRGFIVRPNGSVCALPAAPAIDALAAALKGRGVRIVWPGESSERACASDGVLLLPVSMHADFVRALDAAVYAQSGRRVYGAVWGDNTMAVWTIAPPRAPLWWPRVSAAEIAGLHAGANGIAFAAANDVE